MKTLTLLLSTVLLTACGDNRESLRLQRERLELEKQQQRDAQMRSYLEHADREEAIRQQHRDAQTYGVWQH